MNRHLVYLTYLFPLFIDTVVAVICFVNPVRFAKLNMTPSQVAAVLVVINLVYMVATFVISRIVNPRNAFAMMLCGCLLYALICAGFLCAGSVMMMYVLVGTTAIAGALFFPPFQVFMKANALDTGGRITVSIGIYGMAWSIGFAIGPLIAGHLMGLGSAASAGSETSGWKYAYIVSGCMSLAALAGLWFFAIAGRTAAKTRKEQVDASAPVEDGYAKMPDLAWLGWTVAFVGVMVYYAARGVLPSRFTNVLKLSEGSQGLIFFIISIAQAMTSLLLCLGKRWMYRPLPLSVFGIAGVAGFVVLGIADSLPALWAASAVFGIYSGGFFYYLVFHSVVHPTKSSRYISLNETIVGAGGILGPFLAGLVATYGSYLAAFASGGGLILLATIVQVIVHARTNARLRPETLR